MQSKSLIRRLKSDLTAAHFTVESLTDLWGAAADAALFRGQRVPALRALEEQVGAAASLARLFVLGLPVCSADVGGALPELGVDGAVALGLLEVAGDTCIPRLDVRPYRFDDGGNAEDFWIVSDLGELSLGHAIPEEHVLGVGGASNTLSRLMISDPVDTVLDLGTGCGIQALHAARHARLVVATDISQRALNLATLNAELNGFTNIEFRLGSLYEPVAGERFDRIISNPPFVITPRAPGVPSYDYRDGGMVGDSLVAEVIRSAAAHLVPGGVAQFLGNWEYQEEQTGLDRLGEWLAGTGLDAWVIEREVQSAEQYAETWIRDGGVKPGGEFDTLYDAWLDDFASRRVTRVGFGYVTLRMPQGKSTLRRLERHHGGTGSAGLGEVIAATLRAHDWQFPLSDEALAQARLTVAPDVTEERHYWPGQEDPTVMTLRQGGGFAREFALDTALAAIVGACDGELTLAAIVAAVAQLLAVDEEELRRAVLPGLRELLVCGFLFPPT